MNGFTSYKKTFKTMRFLTVFFTRRNRAGFLLRIVCLQFTSCLEIYRNNDWLIQIKKNVSCKILKLFDPKLSLTRSRPLKIGGCRNPGHFRGCPGGTGELNSRFSPDTPGGGFFCCFFSFFFFNFFHRVTGKSPTQIAHFGIPWKSISTETNNINRF